MAEQSLTSTERVNPAALAVEDAARALGPSVDAIRQDTAEATISDSKETGYAARRRARKWVDPHPTPGFLARLAILSKWRLTEGRKLDIMSKCE